MPDDLDRAYVVLTDAADDAGPAAGVGSRSRWPGIEVVRRFGIEHVWSRRQPRPGAHRLRGVGRGRPGERRGAPERLADWPHQRYIDRAELEIGRGSFEAARTHLDRCAERTVRDDAARPDAVPARGGRARALGAALGRRGEAVRDGLARAARATRRSSASSSAPRHCARRPSWRRWRRARRELGSPAARALLDAARLAAAEAAAVTPNTARWLAQAEAEYERGRGRARPDAWADAAASGSGSSARRSRRTAAGARQRRSSPRRGRARRRPCPLREAHAVATRLGAQPLLRELELLAERARLDLEPPAEDPGREQRLGGSARADPRARPRCWRSSPAGLTNREIAAELVISVKTADHHVVAHPAQARRSEPGSRQPRSHTASLRPTPRPPPEHALRVRHAGGAAAAGAARRGRGAADPVRAAAHPVPDPARARRAPARVRARRARRDDAAGRRPVGILPPLLYVSGVLHRAPRAAAEIWAISLLARRASS